MGKTISSAINAMGNSQKTLSPRSIELPGCKASLSSSTTVKDSENITFGIPLDSRVHIKITRTALIRLGHQQWQITIADTSHHTWNNDDNVRGLHECTATISTNGIDVKSFKITYMVNNWVPVPRIAQSKIIRGGHLNTSL